MGSAVVSAPTLHVGKPLETALKAAGTQEPLQGEGGWCGVRVYEPAHEGGGLGIRCEGLFWQEGVGQRSWGVSCPDGWQAGDAAYRLVLVGVGGPKVWVSELGGEISASRGR